MALGQGGFKLVVVEIKFHVIFIFFIKKIIFYKQSNNKENNMTNVNQKNEIKLQSQTKTSIKQKIDLIVAGTVDHQKLSIEGMVDIYNAFKNKLIPTTPKQETNTALIDYFKKDVMQNVIGATWEFFTKSNINKKDLEKMNSEDRTKAEENKIYKMGSLKGRAFLNFCKGGYTLYFLDGLYRNQPDKNGQLLIKMDAVKKLKNKKQQSFWDSKINNVEYAMFSYNDMIRAYLTLFGVGKGSKNNSKSFLLITDLINHINGFDDVHKFFDSDFDIFLPDELKGNKSKVFQLIDLLLNITSERAEKHTKQGNKRKYDVVSEKLFVEYKQIKSIYDNYEPEKKAI